MCLLIYTELYTDIKKNKREVRHKVSPKPKVRVQMWMEQR